MIKKYKKLPSNVHCNCLCPQLCPVPSSRHVEPQMELCVGSLQMSSRDLQPPIGSHTHLRQSWTAGKNNSSREVLIIHTQSSVLLTSYHLPYKEIYCWSLSFHVIAAIKIFQIISFFHFSKKYYLLVLG